VTKTDFSLNDIRNNTEEEGWRTRSHPWSERQIVAWLFFSLWLTYAYFIPSPYLTNPNIISRIGLTLSLAETGSLDIDAVAAHTIDKASSGGHYFSDKAPGTSLTALIPVLPLVWILKAFNIPIVPFVGRDLSLVAAIVIYIATAFTSSLFTAAAAAMLYVLARHWRATRGAALFAALAFGVATPAAGQATLFFGHALAGSCLWIGFATAVLILEARAARRTEIALAFLSGVLLVWAVVAEFTAAPASLGIALYALARTRHWLRPRRHNVVAAALLGGVLAVLPLLVHNKLAFGAPFELGYSKVVGFAGMAQGFMGLSVPRAGIVYELLFGRHRGILWVAPIGLAWPFALWACRRWLSLATAAVLVLVPLSFLLINAGYYYWDGGYSTGPRFLTPALAFICLPLAFLWMSVRRAWLGAVLALAGLSGLVTLVCISVDMTAPRYYADPLFDYLLPRFLAGRIHDVYTMAVAQLFLPDIWTGSAPGQSEYEFILKHNLAGWQTLASLAILPAIWLTVAVVVYRFPSRIHID
jgi:hypothetical protein